MPAAVIAHSRPNDAEGSTAVPLHGAERVPLTDKVKALRCLNLIHKDESQIAAHRHAQREGRG